MPLCIRRGFGDHLEDEIVRTGVETVILPTAVLSTHTMFPDFTVKDLTDQLVPITDHWKARDIKFDAIYTGYLGSAEELQKE